MKIFKKTAAMLLGLTMSVSLFACGGDDDNSSSSKGGLFPEGNIEDGEGAKYLEGTLNAFKEAETITIDFQLTANASGLPNATQSNPSAPQTAEITATYVLAKTDDGYNMSMSGTMKDTDGSVDETKVLIVDGWVYEYYEEYNDWRKGTIASSMDDESAEMLNKVGEIYNQIMSDDADFSEIYAKLGPILEEFLYIENNEYKFLLDMKDEVNAAIDYVANFDYSQTLETYLNSVLADCGSTKTVKAIFDEVATYGAYTVGEAYADLNEILVQETGKNVNGLKADLVAELNAMDTTLLEKYFSAADIYEFKSTLAQINAMDIDQMIQPYASLTMDDIVNMLAVKSVKPDATPYAQISEDDNKITLKDICDEGYLVLSTMTFEDVLPIKTMERIKDVSESLAHVTISDLSEGVSIKFNGYKISSFAYTAKAGGSYVTDEDNISANAEYSCKVAFSKEKTTITAPENVE